jgi:hypothetical protein
VREGTCAVELFQGENKIKGANMMKLALSPIGSILTLLLVGASGSALAEAPAASLGTLEYGTDVYYPQGCAHNGSTVVCTFVFVHQAETAQIRAGIAGSQLTGIQFVDDGHVPHNPNNAYFVDRYGARQHVLVVNRADQGTMVVEFPLVDARVSTGEFHLASQILAGIPVAATAGGAAPGAPNALAAGGAQASAPAAAGAQQTAAQNGCNTPQLANTQGCKLSAKIHQAEASSSSAATSVTAPVTAVSDAAKQIGALFGGLSTKKAEPAPQPAPAQ